MWIGEDRDRSNKCKRALYTSNTFFSISSRFLISKVRAILKGKTEIKLLQSISSLKKQLYWEKTIFGVFFLNATREVERKQVNFTKTFQNKEFKKKLVDYFRG